MNGIAYILNKLTKAMNGIAYILNKLTKAMNGITYILNKLTKAIYMPQEYGENVYDFATLF